MEYRIGCVGWLTVVACLLAASPVQAGHITISSSMNVVDDFADGTGVVEIELTNQGDESAYDVRLAVEPRDFFQSKETRIGILGPAKPRTEQVTVALTDTVNRGTYPLAVKIKYTDSNGHPFSIVAPMTVSVQEEAPAQVRVFVERLMITPGSGATLDVVVRNPSQEVKTIRTLFFGPDEIEVRAREKTATISGGSQSAVGYYVGASDRALAGSNYAVLVAISYVEDGIHHSRFATGRVGITAQRTPLAEERQGPLDDGVFVGLALFVVLLTAGYIYLDAKVS